VTEPLPQPLTAEQIESLLRAAQNRHPAVRSDVVSSEPLGPGDVQYLRNTSLSEYEAGERAWLEDRLPADELLERAEQQLAAALSTQDDISAAAPGSSKFEAVTPGEPDIFPFAAFDSAPAPAAIPVEFANAAPANGITLESLGDIELDVTLELGRVELTIEELLQLRAGSVVPLNKAAGDPIDILANGRLVARGEVIVVEDRFGVRICEVITPR